MKKIVSPLCGCLLTAISLHAETLFAPGSITIATNEVILIDTIGGGNPNDSFYLDGLQLLIRNAEYSRNPRYAIAGPHILSVSNAPFQDNCFVSFQRL